MRYMRYSLLPFLLLAAAPTCAAAEVGNFLLLDQHGETHELHSHHAADAVVLLVQGNGCPIVRNALKDLREVRERFQDEDVEFLMLNANLQDHAATIRAEAEEWDIDLPILIDETQQVGEALGLTRTAEALLLDPATWTIAYRGPINDRLTYERQRAAARQHYLADALDAVLAGRLPEVRARDAVGCLINFPARTNGGSNAHGHHGHAPADAGPS